MDALKEIFIKDSPEQIDLPNGHSSRFEKKLENEFHKRKFMLWISISATAAGIVLLLLFASVFSNFSQDNTIILSSTDAETVESEYYLRYEIQNRLNKINTIEAGNFKDKSLMKDINDLDESLSKLRTDLNKSPNDQRIINAVITTYRLKLQALDNILTILHKYS
jgi:hypothetical protein